MNAELGRLTKVLELERGQGYCDRAVIGGLEAFVNHWRSEVAGRVASDVVARVAADLEGYTDMDGAARRQQVEAVLRLVTVAAARPGPPTPRVQGAAPRDVAPQGAPPPSEARPRGDGNELARPVVHLKGVGLKSAQRLKRMGIVTVRDLLLHAPRRYEDFRAIRSIANLQPGQQATVVATVAASSRRRLPGGRDLLSVTLTDTTGRFQVRFFNQGYLERQLPRGRQVVVSGAVETWAGRLGFTSPAWEPLDAELIHTGRLVPVYPLTKGLGQRWLRRRVRTAVDQFAAGLPDPLPSTIREAEGLLPLAEAVRAIHVPSEMEDVEAGRRRLAFDELLIFQIRARQRRRRRQAQPGVALARAGDAVADFAAALPFALTGAQKRCLAEISADMEGQRPMARLLQGDVGSGKTAVAAGAAAACVASGHRAAVMAPTEILAEQHQSAFADLLAPLGFRTFGSPGNGATIALLVGSLPAREKERIRSAARDGEVDVLIGTHALIQNRVAVKGLALVVVDEQHRFGVLQRAELVAKGDGGGVPHQMVMTATPIPRTLSMVLDASLDQSIIDEMPPGRRPAETLLLSPNDRERAYQFIRHRVAMGEQAFVVCPLVEASDGVSAEAAIVEYDRLTRDVYPDLTVGLVHGRMAPAEKEAAMAAFRSGEMSILVATTVIEVGVDVPNATVMMVQDADRFGLAQLHQLRGRVGRGTAGGTCILLTGSDAPRALRRLEAVAKTADGLELAALDLEIRGPGEFFGVRQAGEADGLRFARAAPPDTLSQAARVAAEIIAADPDLAEGRHAGLARLVTARGADPLPT